MFSQHTTWTHRSDPLPQRQAACRWRAADRNLSARCTVLYQSSLPTRLSRKHLTLLPAWLCAVFSFLGDIISHIKRFSEKCWMSLSKRKKAEVRASGIHRHSAEQNTAKAFCGSRQQRSTRGSKNVRHVWTSLSQSALQPWALRRQGHTEAKREEQIWEGKDEKGREGWEAVKVHDGATWKTFSASKRGQSHQTGLPRFQSLLTFVNHQPVSLHWQALPAVTPSTQTGLQQLLCLKEGLWISQH